MAQLNAIVALRKIKKEAPQVMLVYGAEEALVDEVIRQYLSLNGQIDRDSLNNASFSAKETESSSIFQILHTPPMLAMSRVVTVSEFDLVWASKDLRQEWLNAIDKLPLTTKLLLKCDNKPDKRQKLFKRIDEIGYVVECQRLNNTELAQWLGRELKRNGKQMSNEDKSYFIEVAGTSLQILKLELDKLLAYTVNEKIISRKIIDSVVAPSLEAGIFACVDAIGQRDVKKAYSELENLFAVSEPPLRILAMIIRQIRLVYKAKLLDAEGATTYKLMKELSIPEFVAKKLIQQTYNFNDQELKQVLYSLNDLEERIKQGAVEPKFALEYWLLRTALK